MTKKPSLAFNPSRRDTLKKTGIALCATMLPLASTRSASERGLVRST